MFELKDVYASYGEGMVLRHVSLEAPKGRVTCLVGRNGAGKTTLLSLMSAQNPVSGAGSR